MTAEQIRRTDSVRVKLSPDMLSRVEKLAADFGMPPATFCAFAVADFVNRHDQNQRLARQAVGAMLKPMLKQFEDLMNSEALNEFVEDVVTKASKLAAGTTALDSKADKGDA